MALDEQATIAALDSARQTFRSAINANRGRVVDMAGDSVLAVFETATGAVTAAIAIQHVLGSEATGLPEERRMWFRIGIHLGDVIEKGDGTAYGDGVNIAARLEGLAAPGGITVSDAVRGAVRNRLPIRFDDQGEQKVKNIVESVRAFRVADEAGRHRDASATKSVAWWQRWHIDRRIAWLLGGIVTAAAVALGVAWRAETTGIKVRPTVSSPQVALLTFSTLVSEAPAEEFAALFTRDLSVTLRGTVAHFAWPVLTSPSPASQPGPSALQRIGRELNAHYVVTGEVRHTGGQIGVDLQIFDSSSGTQVWSGQVDTAQAKLAQTPDLAVMRTTAVLRRALYELEERRILSAPLNHLTPAELIIRANATDDSTDVDRRAKDDLYAKARERDPNLVPALVGWADQLTRIESPSDGRERRLQEADDLSRRAISLASGDAIAWYVRSWVLWNQYRYDAALAANTTAIQLDPSRAMAFISRAVFTLSLGQPEAALPMLDRAMDIDASVEGVASRVACRAFLSLGRYDEAIKSCERAIATDESWLVHMYLTAAYAQKGDMARATEAKARLLLRKPGITLAQVGSSGSSAPDAQRFREQWETHIAAGLRKACIPER